MAWEYWLLTILYSNYPHQIAAGIKQLIFHINIYDEILVSYMSICNGCTKVGLHGNSQFQFLV